ncbi:phosphatidylglycerophosphatase A [Elusimicrobiota bacterium]
MEQQEKQSVTSDQLSVKNKTILSFAAFLASGFWLSHVVYNVTKKSSALKSIEKLFPGADRWKGCGLVGTAGGFVVALVFSGFIPNVHLCPLIVCLLAATAVSVLIAFKAEKYYNRKDDSRIVIDEFIGYLWAVVFVLPADLTVLAAAFILFRIFDVIKLSFIRKLEELPYGFGCVLDDVASGILAALIIIGSRSILNF